MIYFAVRKRMHVENIPLHVFSKWMMLRVMWIIQLKGDGGEEKKKRKKEELYVWPVEFP